MRTINGYRFDYVPGYCGECPFWFGGDTSVPVVGSAASVGLCTLRADISKPRYANAPKACVKLFEKAMTMDGPLIVVLKD